MLAADYPSRFEKDYRRCRRARRGMEDLRAVVRLILEDTEESRAELVRRRGMHTLKGKWRGREECRISNAGDWLLIWSDDGVAAYFERTGAHDGLFRWPRARLSGTGRPSHNRVADGIPPITGNSYSHIAGGISTKVLEPVR